MTAPATITESIGDALFETLNDGTQIPKVELKSNMDDANAAIVDKWRLEGEKAAVASMFTGDNGERLSYGEMRRRYG